MLPGNSSATSDKAKFTVDTAPDTTVVMALRRIMMGKPKVTIPERQGGVNADELSGRY
ncbi:hypothetical protein INT80_12525 [Gallibacterium anatis]|uniref:Uncharacterized protein n=1 Tax=Gallibacterium anatis TaxID=750 RepID=A0A930YAU6_9PAST|nr:hypothetical protein [Gallibacterium anatis]